MCKCKSKDKKEAILHYVKRTDQLSFIGPWEIWTNF